MRSSTTDIANFRDVYPSFEQDQPPHPSMYRNGYQAIKANKASNAPYSKYETASFVEWSLHFDT